VDAAIVTDLLLLAFRGSYDRAILATGDADFIPAVKYLQSTGSRVINAGWGGHGHDLKRLLGIVRSRRRRSGNLPSLTVL
jgi:uncharacterized LabA/DUF88 family protein